MNTKPFGQRWAGALVFYLCLLPGMVAADAVQGSVADLAWMSGSWSGPMGGGLTLEENWNQPAHGTIACLMRMSGNGKTNIVELILIEDSGDSLVFRVRQWRPGLVPLDPPGQTMRLDELGEQRVSFVAADSVGGFNRLTYSRPKADIFQINVEPRQGEPFQLQLRPASPSNP